jgi:hypothetical protein
VTERGSVCYSSTRKRNRNWPEKKLDEFKRDSGKGNFGHIKIENKIKFTLRLMGQQPR